METGNKGLREHRIVPLTTIVPSRWRVRNGGGGGGGRKKKGKRKEKEKKKRKKKKKMIRLINLNDAWRISARSGAAACYRN